MNERERHYLPVLLDITDKRILMIGAGQGCAAKLQSLSQLKRQIDVISPEFHSDFLNKDWIRPIKRKYQTGDLNGYHVVYAGVNDPVIEGQILAESRHQGILVNFVNHVDRSDFISPSSLIRKHFAIFISTFGQGPGITKKIRTLIERNIDLDALDLEARNYIENRTQK